MPQICSSLLSLLLLALSSCCTLVSCIESEAQALLAWRSSLKYPGNLTEMWSDQLSSDPCHWDGIGCNDAGSITVIFYYGPSVNNFSNGPPIDGTLSKFNFSSIPNHAVLAFDSNNLHGEIPEEIGSLHKLRVLPLGDNRFTGQFPTAICNFPKIENLDLWSNKLTGAIPVEIMKLSNIYELDLFGNNFIGDILASIGNLSQLKFLSLDDNYFTGTIPREMGHLDKLNFLGLSRNRLSGHIPVEIGNITRLKFIDFGYNELQGEVPTLHAQIFRLELNNNQLTDFPYIGNNSELSYIDLSNNRFMGTIPPLICTGVLEDFIASNNFFDNLLPITLQNCTNFGTSRSRK